MEPPPVHQVNGVSCPSSTRAGRSTADGQAQTKALVPVLSKANHMLNHRPCQKYRPPCMPNTNKMPANYHNINQNSMKCLPSHCLKAHNVPTYNPLLNTITAIPLSITKITLHMQAARHPFPLTFLIQPYLRSSGTSLCVQSRFLANLTYGRLYRAIADSFSKITTFCNWGMVSRTLWNGQQRGLMN